MDWPLLESLSAADRQEVLRVARRRKYPKGTTLFWEGDPGDGLHLVVRGHAAIQLTTRRGDVATVRVIGAGGHFGELALTSQGPRSATVVALDALETLSLHRDDFERLRTAHPAVNEVLIEALADEVRRLAGALRDALYLDAKEHLWCRLHDLVVAFAVSERDGPVVIPLTQAELASLAGVTRQTTHAFLQNAVEKGVVRLDKKGAITVTDPAAVAGFAAR
jgi:CRP-like cAMP-binding protein